MGYTLSRSSRSARLTRHTREQLSESEQVIADLEDKMNELQDKFKSESQVVNEKWAKVAAQGQSYQIAPYKKDIQVEMFGVGWVPHYYVQVNGQPLLLLAYS